MNYPVNTSVQLKAVLRGMRKSKSLSQLEAGHLLGVNQKRAARIESNPGVTSFDQITRLVAALGGRVVIEMADKSPPPINSKGKSAARMQGTHASKIPSKPSVRSMSPTSDA
jgi:HTH-type transcriptional regulator / antitoxin HipB